MLLINKESASQDTLFTADVDGRKIEFAATTEFLVQVGRNVKASYKTQFKFVGNVRQAMLYYNGINIGNGYKKRLVMVGADKPVLARAVG